jgi:hypothetical protein
MPERDLSSLCPPHHWEVTLVRIDGISYYHHCCKKCRTEKDISHTAAGATRWVSRKPNADK